MVKSLLSFFLLVIIYCVAFGSLAQAEDFPIPQHPIRTGNIQNGGTYDNPMDVRITYDAVAWSSIPMGAADDCPTFLGVWLMVDGVATAPQTRTSTDFIGDGFGCDRGRGSMTFSLNLSPGQHAISYHAVTSWYLKGRGFNIFNTWNYSPNIVTIRPPIPTPTILVDGTIWGGRVSTVDTPFTLQITGTNNPTQCFLQTTNAPGQTRGYQSFPCDKYLTPKSVRPSDFNFTEGVNTFNVYMVNAYGTSKTAVNWATVAPLPEATVLLNGKPDDVTVSTLTSPFRLQITGSNNPTHCYMDTGSNSDFEFPCDKYVTETTVLPSDFGFTDGRNQMRVWVENDNGMSDRVIRNIFIRPIPEVTLLLNGASQDIRVPLTSTPFTLQITGTNNPQQCYMKAINSSGQGDFYQWFDCDEYKNPRTVVPGNWPFFFQNGVNTIRVYMTNQYGDASDEVSHAVTIGTFRPSVSFLLNGLPQDLVLATAASPFDIRVSFIDNPTACYESRKIPSALVWGPYIKLSDNDCSINGVIEASGVSPLTFGLQTGVNGIRYYASNAAGNSNVVTRYITVPLPTVNTLALCTDSGISIAIGTRTTGRILVANTSEQLKAYYDNNPSDCAGTEVTNGWSDTGSPIVSISGNGTSPQTITAGSGTGTEAVTIAQGADTIIINYSVISPPCVPNCSNSVNVCQGTLFTSSNSCSPNDCVGEKNCNYNWREIAP
jgi:hypothetical protein